MIRLVTVIGHGVNLLPHFIRHYRDMVDEIHIVVYKNKQNPNIEAEVNEIIKDEFRVNIVKVHSGTSFHWETVTDLYNKVKNDFPDDWWVVADIDEFHVYTISDLKGLTDNCDLNGWEIVRGGFIDRIGKDGDFPTINKNPDINIFDQFPMMGFFRYPMSNACPNKICLMKGYIKLTSGQHYAEINGETTWRWQGWNHPLIAPFDVQVHHFKWDSTCFKRMKDIIRTNADYAASSEYQSMYISLEDIGFNIDINNEKYMFEERKTQSTPTSYGDYKQWDKLIKKIITI